MQAASECSSDHIDSAAGADIPRWTRWFGLASIVVALSTSAVAGLYLHDLYKQLLRSELTMLFAGMSMPWHVIIPAIVAWACGVGLSMVVLLLGGVLAVAGSRWARPLHLASAVLIFLATVGTFVALSVLINHAGAVSWPPGRYVILAVMQSLWGWIIIFTMGSKGRTKAATRQTA